MKVGFVGGKVGFKGGHVMFLILEREVELIGTARALQVGPTVIRLVANQIVNQQGDLAVVGVAGGDRERL